MNFTTINETIFHFYFIHCLLEFLKLKKLFHLYSKINSSSESNEYFFDVEGWKNLIKLIFIFRSRKSRRLFSTAKGVNKFRFVALQIYNFSSHGIAAAPGPYYELVFLVIIGPVFHSHPFAITEICRWSTASKTRFLLLLKFRASLIKLNSISRLLKRV